MTKPVPSPCSAPSRPAKLIVTIDGRTLAELRIRSTFGASVVGIIRAGSVVANPDGQSYLEKGDLVAVLGTRDQIARFERGMRPSAL